MKRRTEDDLDRHVRARERRDPGFALLVEEAVERRALLRRLAQERGRQGVSQTAVAARMNTSQSAVARLETGDMDAKISTVGRYAAALGKKVRWQVVPAAKRRRAVANVRRG